MIEAAELDQGGFGLRQYLEVTRRRKWLVLGVTATAIAVAVAASLLQDSTYRAETKIVIGQGNSLFQPGLANAFQPFTATASDLVTSNVVARTVIKNLDLRESPEELLDKVSVSINPETAVLKIGVTDTDRNRARRIAQEIGESFSALFNERFGRSTPTAPGQTPVLPLTATVWDPAHALPGRVSPQPVRNVAVAGVLGLIVGLLAAFLREHFDRALRTRDAVEQEFGIPVIGQIPFERTRRREQRSVFWSGFGEAAESFRALRANLQYLAVKRPLRTILVTSASPVQGKTTVTANLAVAIARSGATTIVVEGDLRRPRLDEAFNVAYQGPGLTSVLVGNVDVDDAVIDIPLPVTPNAPSEGGQIAFLPSGPLPPNPSELLSSLQMTTLLDRLSTSYDYVLLDSPPLLLVADALELARMVDGVVLVVRRNRATSDEAREVRAIVDRLGIHLVGAVFTDVKAIGAYGVYAEDQVTELELPVSRAREPVGREEL